MNLIITLLVILLNCYTHADDPDRQLSKCEVCKFLAVELSENLRDHNSTDRLQLSYNLDDMDKRTISYQTSETRLTEVLDSLCARILEYNVHAERSGSNRYAKGRSQTMDSLWGLRNRGVKVVLDVPDDMWDHPSAEITNLEKSCNYMLEEYEDAIRDWYFSKNEEPLTKYLCEDRVLLEQNTLNDANSDACINLSVFTNADA
ncbi:hypothetical protein GJ496_000899 [Pomphorhynchus laevis]|nr:hypothetical protein GJ496_000899 [Pomphorhynchus laevis]